MLFLFLYILFFKMLLYLVNKINDDKDFQTYHYICTYMYTHIIYIYMYVCMYVCMHACIHACMHVCMYIYICMYVCMYVHICTHTHAHTHAHTPTHIQIKIHMHICALTYITFILVVYKLVNRISLHHWSQEAIPWLSQSDEARQVW